MRKKNERKTGGLLINYLLTGLKIKFHSGASRRLTEKFWSPDCKFWSPTSFIYNLQKNTILYVIFHARKVKIEERKQLETTRVTPSY